MEMIDKIKLMESVIMVADFWEVTPSELVGFVGSFIRPEKAEEWNSIANEVQEFNKMNTEERASKLGFTISKLKEKE